MTTHTLNVKNITFNIHNVELSLELSEILVTAIKTLENNPEFKKGEVQNILIFLNKIEIYLSNEKSKFQASYQNNKIEFHIDLCLNTIKSMNQYELNSYFQEILIHEITHLFHDTKSKYIQRFNYRKNKFKKKLQPSLFGRIIPFNKSNWKREDLLELFNDLYIEGMATYIQHINKEIDFKQLQIQSKETILKIKDRFLEYKKHGYKLKTNESDSYTIGLLMTKIILSDKKINLSFEQLSEIGFKQFIELYEKAAENQNYEILVSYSSKKGIFDYQSSIKDWKKEKRESKK